MSDREETKRAWKEAGSSRQRPKANKFEALRKPGESVMDCVRRLSDNHIMVEPKSLYMNLVTQSNNDLKKGSVLKYKVAKTLGFKHWIHEMRLNCQCDLPDSWIEENLPSLTRQKLVKPHRSTKPSDAAVTSRDIRLTTDPSLQVVRMNAVDDSVLDLTEPVLGTSEASGETTSKTEKELETKVKSTTKPKPTFKEPKTLEESYSKESTSVVKSRPASVVKLPSLKTTYTQSTERKIGVSSNKRSLTITVDSPRTKATIQETTEYCILSSCGSMDRRARRHALAKHLPAVFKDATGVEHLPGAVQALRWLVHMAYGQEASLWDAVHRVNQSGLIPESANLNPLHHKLFIEACKLLQISEPSHFTLRPINSPAVLLFWRCIMVILNNCIPDQQQQFYHFQPSEDPSKDDKMVEEASDSELPSDLEEFILVDEADSDQDESTVLANTSLPQVFDAHFHLDRSLRAVWGRSGGRTVEELLQYSFSSDVSYKPAIKVDVVGGIIVYSEPKSYPEVNFTLQGPWKVAIGVHPKHYDTLTVEKTMKMQQLLDHPKIVALGECGLDRTIAPSQWCRQEEVFVRLLKLSKVEQPLVLHLRGPRGDTYSSDVHGRCLMLMEDICDPEQKIHVHCFMGRADVVRTWLRKFPNTYFGVTAAVRAFDHEQLEGLQAIPHNKLLLETDAPYFPLGGAIVSTPAYLGEVAAYLSVHLNMRPPELMRTTVMNARKLYGC